MNNTKEINAVNSALRDFPNFAENVVKIFTEELDSDCLVTSDDYEGTSFTFEITDSVNGNVYMLRFPLFSPDDKPTVSLFDIKGLVKEDVQDSFQDIFMVKMSFGIAFVKKVVQQINEIRENNSFTSSDGDLIELG